MESWVAVDWAALPSELLAVISGGLGGDPVEVVRFRSVCKAWRLSTPLSTTNKLSLLFPLQSPVWGKCDLSVFDLIISANAVYLVRPKSHPSNSKAWLVSLHEPAAGNLVLRDPLLNKELKNAGSDDLEVDSIAATQTLIARSYAHCRRCTKCNGICVMKKVVFVCEPESGQLVGLCAYPNLQLFGFRLDWRTGAAEAVQLAGRDGRHRMFYDLVKFIGRIFAVDAAGILYLLHHSNLELLPIARNPVREDIRGIVHRVRFVVSDGDLYLVWLSYQYPPYCQVYRLVVVNDEQNNKYCTEILVEQVKDLGDRVFFITPRTCFSVSAPLLPHPWKGNCVFFCGRPIYMCRCNNEVDYKNQGKIFHLEDQTFTKISAGYSELFSQTFTKISSSMEGYSDLFSPPASFVLI